MSVHNVSKTISRRATLSLPWLMLASLILVYCLDPGRGLHISLMALAVFGALLLLERCRLI